MLLGSEIIRGHQVLWHQSQTMNYPLESPVILVASSGAAIWKRVMGWCGEGRKTLTLLCSDIIDMHIPFDFFKLLMR